MIRRNVPEVLPLSETLFKKLKTMLNFQSSQLKDAIGYNFNLKFLGNSQIKIQFYTIKDYFNFKQFAIAKNYLFYTYSTSDERSITIILKGLFNTPDLSKKN